MPKLDQVKNTTSLSAKQFLKRLELLRPLNSDSEIGEIKSVPMGKVFALAKDFMGMSLDEIENLLNIVNNSAKTAFSLLEDILLWVRANSGKIPFEPKKLHAKQALMK